ncbi:MAG TPA: hypothetical protein VFR21_05090 [Bradyrhizobium sp.]|jgi:hypothetical protein|nr:hypothetical protein [Bradyrhizobium sp.]
MLLPGLSFKLLNLQSDKVAAVGSSTPRALSAMPATYRRSMRSVLPATTKLQG